MTRVNDRFSFSRDKHSWELIELVDGIDKETKETKKVEHKTYHSNIEQVCHVILDRSAEGSEVEDVVDNGCC
jgi:hypothetical protein